MTSLTTTHRDFSIDVFRLDAVVTGLNGAAYVVAADLLDSALGLSPALLRPTGALLVAYAVLVWFARTPGLRREVVLVNAAWVVASLAFAVTGAFSPTALGTAWIVAQAVVVAGLTWAQGRSLRA